MTGRPLSFALAILLSVTLLGACTATSHPTAMTSSGPAATAAISPHGHGDCSPSAPCSDLAEAIAKAGNGGTVEAQSGAYPDQTLSYNAALSARTRATIIRPAPGAHPILGGINSYVPQLDFEHMSGAGGIYLRSQADHTTFDDLTLRGPHATMLVRASHVLIQNSMIEGGHQLDGIQIASEPRNSFVTVRRTTVRNFTSTTNLEQHPDCIQLFDTSHITIEQDSLYNCFNSAITFSPGAHLGIDHVKVEGNFMQGCQAQRQDCGANGGGSAVDLRVQVGDTVFSHNTIGHGSLRLPANAGVTATANIVYYLSVDPCETALSHSLLVAYTTFACHDGVPGGDHGNWQANVRFRDLNSNDLRLVGSVPRNPDTGAVGISGGLGYRGTVHAGVVGAG